MDEETGKVIDNAQGYGYKSKEKALAAFRFKTKHPNIKEYKKQQKIKYQPVIDWLEKNQNFVDEIIDIQFHIAKGSYGPGAKLTSYDVEGILKRYDPPAGFTAGEILYVMENYT